MSRVARVATRLATATRTAWLIVGVYLALLLCLEALSFLWLRYVVEPAPVYNETNADALAGAEWTADYVREVRRSRASAWHSYVYWRRKPFEGEFINVDVEGKRRGWSPPPAAPGTPELRVFVFGGSTVWGRGARDDFTIPSFLAKSLHEDVRARVSVFNMGESAWVNTQAVIALALELQRGNVPDLVVFYEGANDVFSAYQQGVAGLPQNENRRRVAYEAVERAFFLKAADRTATFRLLKHYFGDTRWAVVTAAPRGYPKSSEAESLQLARDVVAVFASNVKLLEALGQSFGFRSLFYWQPLIFTKPNLTLHEREILAHTLDLFPRLDELFARVQRALAEDPSLSVKENFRDLGDVLGDAQDAYYIDFAHVSEKANALVAAAVARDLVPLIERRLAPGS